MVKVIGQGHQVDKHVLRPHLTGLQVTLKVKGHMGQGQRSHESRSNVTRVKGYQVKIVISCLI